MEYNNYYVRNKKVGRNYKSEPGNLEKRWKPNEEMILKFSNELNVDSYTPPTIIIHSDNDMVVVPENSISYYYALRKNNIPSALHIWEDGGHGYGLGKGRGSIESWPTIVEEWMRLRRIID